MNKLIKKSIVCLLIVQLSISNINADQVASSACKAVIGGGSSAVTILMNILKTSFNVLPIRIAGIPILPSGNEDDKGDSSLEANSPICFCITPFPRIGIPMSYFEPLAVVEVTNIPNCSPTLGTSLPIDVVAGSSFQEIDKSNTKNKESYQVNYIKYPLFKILQLFADVLCLSPDGSVDYLYLSTIDPLWQDDTWSLIVNPDAFLFANQFAQLACIPDAISSQFGYPLDPLYWCFGSWNQTFPLTKATSGVSSPEAAMGIAARTLFKLHRQFMLWGSIGIQALCGKYPMPIMRKSQYGMYPIFPLMTHPERIPIGRSGMLWDAGQDSALANAHTWAIMVYRKRNCCVW